MKRLIFSAALASISALLCAQNLEVQRIESNKVSKEGIFYALPKTVLTLEVEVKKTQTTAPKNAGLCQLLLAIAMTFLE